MTYTQAYVVVNHNLRVLCFAQILGLRQTYLVLNKFARGKNQRPHREQRIFVFWGFELFSVFKNQKVDSSKYMSEEWQSG